MRGNCLCPYHHLRDKEGRQFDEAAEEVRKFDVTGTPQPRLIAPRGEMPIQAEDGYLNCGCEVERVLLDFWWWKSEVVTSPTTGRSEDWDTQRLDPRARVFITKTFQSFTCLTVDDLYNLDHNGEEITEEIRLKKQIARLGRQLKKLEDEKDEELSDDNDLLN